MATVQARTVDTLQADEVEFVSDATGLRVVVTDSPGAVAVTVTQAGVHVATFMLDDMGATVLTNADYGLRTHTASQPDADERQLEAALSEERRLKLADYMDWRKEHGRQP